jgi:hypothetical protein
MWELMMFPWSLLEVVFCIIVIAGDWNPPERRVLRVIMAMENQKLVWHKQHMAVSGKAMKLLAMQTLDFALRSLFSNWSLKIPPRREERNPQTASEAAFATAY